MKKYCKSCKYYKEHQKKQRELSAKNKEDDKWIKRWYANKMYFIETGVG